jgi:hypothetical protein
VKIQIREIQIKKEKQNEIMKWLQLAYSIISVNAVILALLAVFVNLLGDRGHVPRGGALKRGRADSRRVGQGL